MLFVSYYTDENYRRESENLRASLERFGLDYRIDEIADRGDWQKNTSAKADYLRRVVTEHDGPVCWLDADAVIQQRPDVLLNLTAQDADVACHYLNDHELISAVVWLANTPASRSLLHHWQGMCKDRPDVWDQKNLQRSIEEMPGVRCRRLPPEYCLIFDISRRAYPGVEPVIEQFQASRRFKK